MTQPPLPFSNLFVPESHRLWLRMANAGDFALKKTWFYPFKTRFLQRHALSDGWDMQIIERECYSCNGTGIWTDEWSFRKDTCYRCTNGIYDRAHIRLERWDLCGEIYHCPAGRVLSSTRGHRNVIRGWVKRSEPVSDKQAVRAFQRLLLRYEATTYWSLQTYILKNHANRITYSVRRHWRALEIAIQNDACPEVDDLHF